MAVQYETEFFTQSSIYSKSNSLNRRKLNTYFSIPDKGVNGDTGILLFISGFGGNSNSNVYKKMRNLFADKYNLVTIQCDYFGWEFMQDCEKIKIPEVDESYIKRIFTENEIKNIYKNDNFDFNEFLKTASNYNINLEVETILNESIDNFNDMGIMQAIDNISAVLNVMNILYDNGYDFNTKKVILYGQSHGAYLSHLCNAFAPTLFSLIIDNSAWLYPEYISNNSRFLTSYLGKMKIIKKFNYIASRVVDDKQILDLTWLYSNFVNNCSVISYQGTTDHLVNYLKKRIFCNNINNCKYIEIGEDKVDNVIFKSTNHSLDADLLKLFEYSMERMNVEFEKDNVLDLVNEVEFDTHKHKYIINYSNVIPFINIL